MKVKCIIEFEHCGDFDEEYLLENLLDFIENDEQTYIDKGLIKVCTSKSMTYDVFGG